MIGNGCVFLQIPIKFYIASRRPSKDPWKVQSYPVPSEKREHYIDNLKKAASSIHTQLTEMFSCRC